MKKLVVIGFCLFAFFAGSAQAPLHVMTFNIRYNNPGDSLNAWPHRKDNVASQILFYESHIVGVQEALHGQMEELQAALPRYKYFGVGRDDGKTKGEYSAIFYDTTRLQWLKGATFWLAENPESVGAKGWDAAITRIVTWCLFKDRKTGRRFYVFNTHFDHMGKIARAESARLLLRKVVQIAGSMPVVITGDFNAKPEDEPVKILVDNENKAHFTDTKALSKTPHYGPTGTFNAFGPKETSDQPIDHIFIKKGITVLKHATLSETWSGRFSSDHFPVLAVLQF